MLNLKFSLSEELVSKILRPDIKTILVLGGSDTAKTTLIECLLEILIGTHSVGVVDCDMGQSHIGPPTTIAWAKINKEFNNWQELKIEDFCFIGSLSPSGNIERVLEGIRYIFYKAKERTEKIILDTTGYILGFEAVDFKKRKLSFIRPDLIIALERKDELQEILSSFEEFSIFRLPVPEGIRIKSQEARASYRDRLFREYFSKAKEFFLPENRFRGLDGEDLELTDRIVSLRNDRKEDLVLGLIEEKKGRDILVLTPFENIKDVSSIIVGFCKWQRS